MRKIVGFFKSKWVIQLLGVIAVSLLIWFVGPLIAVAGRTPLESEVSRLVTILVIVVLWALNLVRLQAKANRTDRHMMKELTEPAEAKMPAARGMESDEEVGVLSQRFDEALKTLKQARSKGRLGKQYLYELPWYIIIGPPGSGKTTALVNSGLEFPLAERFGKNSVRGVGGTRNCDWWFTNEAVLLDTAGRYTTQDSHEALDRAAWSGFLQLLKKSRPRRPINGVLVTMSMSDLIQLTEEERGLHAQAIRQRIQELLDVLGIRFPIYMLFTKTDLIAGFTDFFAELGVDDRAQVWGETFPVEDPDQPGNPLEIFFRHFDELIARLNQRTVTRLQNERDITRRSRVFGFPQQITALKGPIQSFLQETFAPNRYHQPPLLRGVYFTSGTQEGTPIDRLMGALADAYGLDRQLAPAYSGKGKSFFITRLLSDVIFREAELAGANQKLERRRRWIQRGAYAGALGLTAAAVAAWTTSFTRNEMAIAEMDDRVVDYHKALAETPGWDVNIEEALPRLDAAAAASTVYSDDVPLSMQFGLYQGDKLDPAADAGYHRVLRNYFRHLIRIRLEQRMNGPEGQNTDILYELLRVYLMLGDPEKLDPKSFKPWVALDWENRLPQEPEVQTRLNAHLDALLALKLDPLTLDEGLIQRTRDTLTRVPKAHQVYARLKSEAATDTSLDFHLLEALGPYGDRVFVSTAGDLAAQRIPGLYTYAGFQKIFLKESLRLAKETISQNWVLGDTADAARSPLEIERLNRDLQRLYLADYEQQWRRLLSNLQVVKFRNVSHAVEVLEIMSGPVTPLRGILEAVERNTTLTRTSAAASKAAELGAEEAVRASSTRTKQLLSAAKEIAGAAGVEAPELPGKELERVFEPINLLVRSSGGIPAPLNNILADLGELHAYLNNIASAGDLDSAALSASKQRMAGGGGDIVGRIRLQAARSPEPMKSWLEAVSSKSWGTVVGSAKGGISTAWRNDVLSECRRALEGRYPFAKGTEQETNLVDFGNFFGPGGTMDQFFQQYLEPFVDTQHRDWRLHDVDRRTFSISSDALRQFQYAAKIRDIFFRGGGKLPTVEFSMKPLSLDASVSRFRLDLDGQMIVYRHGPAKLDQFKWPGPDRTGRVRVVFEASNGKQVSLTEDGPWAWFRVLDRMSFESTSYPDRFKVTFDIDGYKARYELRANSVVNPFRLPELEKFHCPQRL